MTMKRDGKNGRAKARPAYFSFCYTEAGFSLVELMIVTAIVGIVAVGMSSLFIEMSLLQNKSEQGVAFLNVRNLITQAIRSPPQSATPGAIPGWDRTVQNVAQNPEMACLRDNTPCVSLVGGVRQWNELTVLDSGGGVVFDGHSATAGFNSRGVACNTFSVGAPDASCPLSYDLHWSVTCPAGEDSCTGANIEVRGVAQYSVPAHIHRSFDPGKHSFLISRGGAVRRNERIEFVYARDESGFFPNAPGEPGGAACLGNWAPRQFNRIISDPGGSVSLVSATQFQLVAGTYSCRIRAPSFKAGGVRIRLRGVAGAAFTTEHSAPVVSGQANGFAAAQIDTNFLLAAPTTFVVEQYCTDAPTAPDAADTAFGRAQPGGVAADWANVTYAAVSCDRVRCFGAGCIGD